MKQYIKESSTAIVINGNDTSAVKSQFGDFRQGNITMSRWMSYWYIVYKQDKIKENTQTSYITAIRRMKKHHMGSKILNQLVPDDMEDYLHFLESGNAKMPPGRRGSNRKFKSGPLKPKSILNEMDIIKRCLSKAVALGYISSNPAICLELPKVNRQFIDALTLEEQHKLMLGCSVCTDSVKLATLIALYCGLRLGEVLALRWSDYDFKNKMLIVDKNQQRVISRPINTMASINAINGNNTTSKIVDGTTKTVNGRRRVPVPEGLQMELQKAIIRQTDEFKSKERKLRYEDHIIYSSKTLSHFDNSNFSKKYSRLVEGLTGTHHTFHQLRHTFCTRYAECGLNMPYLATIVGHSTSDFTFRKYCAMNATYELEGDDFSEFFNRLGVTYTRSYSGECDWKFEHKYKKPTGIIQDSIFLEI